MPKSSVKQIWVFNQFAGTPESGWGERHYYFSRYWQELGYQVKIFSGSFNHVFTRNVVVDKGIFKQEDYNGVPFYWIKTPRYKATSVLRFYSMLVFMCRLFFLPVKKLGKPDVVIVSSMPIFSVLSGYYFKRKYGAKLLFEIRDIWPLTLQLLGNKSSYHPAVLLMSWFERFGYRRSDCVISLLPNAKAHVEMVAGREIVFHYIPNGIDPKVTRDDPIPVDLGNLLSVNKFIVGYAGTLGLANAMEYLVDAAKLINHGKQILIVVIGDGYKKNELIRRANNLDNIIFYPRIKKEYGFIIFTKSCYHICRLA